MNESETKIGSVKHKMLEKRVVLKLCNIMSLL